MAVNNSLGPDSEADSGWYVGGLYGARGRQEKCLNFYPRPGVLSRLRVNNISSDDQHFRILPSIRKIYQMRDNRKRKIGSKRRIDYTICNFPVIYWNITPKNDRFFDSRERNEISLRATLSKRNEISGAPTLARPLWRGAMCLAYVFARV